MILFIQYFTDRGDFLSRKSRLLIFIFTALIPLTAVSALIFAHSFSRGGAVRTIDEARTAIAETETASAPTTQDIKEVLSGTETSTKKETTSEIPPSDEAAHSAEAEASKETKAKAEKETAKIAAPMTNSFTRTSDYAKSLAALNERERTFEDNFCLKIEEICKRFSAVGFSLVVFKDDEELYSQVYGFADKEKGLYVDENTKFRVASMSKFATGILVMRLASEGKADLDADISEYTGIRIRSPYYDDVVITPRMLMNHSSSIIDGDWAFTKGALLSDLFKKGDKTYFSPNKPGSTYIYSNFGASLLTCLIEKASGRHFVEYSQSALIKPLGLDAAYSISQIKDRDSVAEMYIDGKLCKSQKTKSATTYGCLNTPLGEYFQLSFGNLMISPRDMSRLAMVLAGDGSLKGVRVLPKEAVAAMNKRVEGSGSPWGLMQKIVADKLVKGRTLHGHNGEAYGFIGCVYYDREDKTGLVYMTNGCRHSGGKHTYAITEEVVSAVYGGYIDMLK